MIHRKQRQTNDNRTKVTKTNKQKSKLNNSRSNTMKSRKCLRQQQGSGINFTFMSEVGERSLENNTLLNLILGEQLLPCSVLGTSSTICELKYGTMPKLVAQTHTGETFETSQKSNLRKILSFIYAKENGENGRDYERSKCFGHTAC